MFGGGHYPAGRLPHLKYTSHLLLVLHIITPLVSDKDKMRGVWV